MVMESMVTGIVVTARLLLLLLMVVRMVMMVTLIMAMMVVLDATYGAQVCVLPGTEEGKQIPLQLSTPPL